MTTAFSLGSINFDDSADSNGARWKITDFSGWQTPSIRSQFAPRTGDHGAIATELLYGARTVVLEGNCNCANSDAIYWLSRNRLAGVCNLLQSSGLLKINENGTTKRLVVYVTDDVKIRKLGVFNFEFMITLVAPDFRKYNDTLQTVTSVSTGTQTNAGNFDTYPTFVITSAGAPSYSCGGKTVSFGTSIPIGTVIDFATRSVYDGSTFTNYYDRLNLPPQWFSFAAGANTLTVAGSGASTLTFRDAWL